MELVEEFMDAYNEQLEYYERIRSFEEGTMRPPLRSSRDSFSSGPPTPPRHSRAFSSLLGSNGGLYASLASTSSSFQQGNSSIQPPSPTRSTRTFVTNTPIPITKQSRWWQGWIALGIVLLANIAGIISGHGAALTVLSLPVLLFLSDCFNQTDAEDEATRKCALEGFAKGAVLGPLVLAVAETVGGVVLAILCFGKSSFESIFEAARENLNDEPASFSTRLFREASTQRPYGALVFALLSSMLVAGLSEEALKMAIGARQVLRYRAHRRTLNPVMVMTGVGLGLAYAEGVMAVSSQSGLVAVRLACERLLTSFPVHVFCAMWTAKRAGTAVTWVGALLPAALLHGVFDFGIIICSNYFTQYVGWGWSMSMAALTTFIGRNA